MFPPDYHTFRKVWLKLDEKYGSSSLLKTFWEYQHWKLESARNDPQTELKESHMKSTLRVQFLGQWVSNFIRFALRLAIFKMLHILGFSIDSRVNISKCHKIFTTCPIIKKNESLRCIMVATVLTNFGWDQIKTVGGLAFLKLSAHKVMCYKKMKVPSNF